MESSDEHQPSGTSGQSKRILELSERIEELERENKRLRKSAGKSHTDFISPLSNTEIERYSRQLLLSNGFGVEGQKRLLSSSVCVIGAGGIGSTGEPKNLSE